MPLCSLEVAARRLDEALRCWHEHRADGQVWWIGPERGPISQVAVRWPVGYQDEETGESGYAHLAEHALFRGAPGREAREDRLLACGGLSNGRTNSRATMFWSAACHDRRADAFDNEASRYAELVDSRWAEHQAVVIRTELLHKTNGAVDGYARIAGATEAADAAGSTLRRADGFVRDALASGLIGFGGFLRRNYQGSPTVALSGFSRPEAIARFECEPLADVAVRADGPCDATASPVLGTAMRNAGVAHLYPIPEPLGIVDRALLGAAARLLLAGADDMQVRLHLWGDSVTETTTPPFVLMVEAEHGALARVPGRLVRLDRASISRIVDAAREPAAARLSRLAAQLRGPWAAQTWSALLERTGDGGFAAPRPNASTVGEALQRTWRLITCAVEAELAA